MQYNFNDPIRVKLTDEGRRVHRANHAAFLSSLPAEHRDHFPYHPPKEDADGWSQWQGWDLMQTFGAWMQLTRKPPFELTVEIVESSK